MSHQPWAAVAERIRRCATAKGRAQQQLYLIEGERLVRRAIKANVQLNDVALSEEFAQSDRGQQLALQVKQLGALLQVLPEPALLQLAEGRASGVCMGLARLPTALTLDAWLAAHKSPEPSGPEHAQLLLIAADIDEPGNVGALTRTALASGVDAMVALGSTDLFHPKAVRTSMGSVFKLNQCTASGLEEVAQHLRAAGFLQVAAVATGGQPLPFTVLTGHRLALYVGNEARGLPRAVESCVNACVTIPMPSGVDSFSVNAAAAIVLYEMVRQRVSLP